MPQVTTNMKHRLAAGLAATGVVAGGLLGVTALNSGTASAFSPPHTAHKYGPWSQVACHTVLIHNQKIAAAHARGDNSSACYSPDNKRFYLYTNVAL